MWKRQDIYCNEAVTRPIFARQNPVRALRRGSRFTFPRTCDMLPA